eukprot:CAMPEP_0174228910 /NCGR_PEP_ID=MMETSP0417-20130205/6_1 /TAXON_ID=242541 /ORGANISM="Mayorella sp, Strain BSH-02190019" /LENGTH=2177 /DNA_ID=CAMNT_0015306395 /DNA_START=208 /DNA_END=6741 /DNA_ORIENTATION=+
MTLAFTLCLALLALGSLANAADEPRAFQADVVITYHYDGFPDRTVNAELVYDYAPPSGYPRVMLQYDFGVRETEFHDVWGTIGEKYQFCPHSGECAHFVWTNPIMRLFPDGDSVVTSTVGNTVYYSIPQDDSIDMSPSLYDLTMGFDNQSPTLVPVSASFTNGPVNSDWVFSNVQFGQDDGSRPWDSDTPNPFTVESACDETELTCFSKLDLMLVLDRSGTIDDTEWELVKDFANKVVDLFPQISDLSVRIGIVLFDTHASVLLPLSGDRASITAAIASMENSAGNTDIAAGMLTGYDLLNGSRLDAPKAMIVMTDGQSNYPSPEEGLANLIAAADMVHAAGVTTYGIGVGLDATNGLYEVSVLIPSEPDYFSTPADFFELGGSETLRELIVGVCDSGFESSCGSTSTECQPGGFCACSECLCLDDSGASVDHTGTDWVCAEFDVDTCYSPQCNFTTGGCQQEWIDGCCPYTLADCASGRATVFDLDNCLCQCTALFTGQLCTECANDASFCQHGSSFLEETCNCDCTDLIYEGDDCGVCPIDSVDWCGGASRATGFVNSADDCYCECDPDFEVDPDTGKCDLCIKDCNGFTANTECVCQCDSYHDGDNCEFCLLSDDDCGLGGVANTDECKCVCPSPAVLSDDSDYSCSCPLPCVGGEQNTTHCACTCDGLFVPSGDSQTCVCPLTTEICNGFTPDTSTGVCSCDCPAVYSDEYCSACTLSDEDCAPGTLSDCKCVGCPAPYVGTDTSCTCPLVSNDVCTASGGVPNLADCSCACASPRELGTDQISCECTLDTDQCSGNTWNADTCVCNCNAQQPQEGALCGECLNSEADCNGGAFDTTTCKCSCVDPFIPGTGAFSCECQLDCVNGDRKADPACGCDCAAPWTIPAGGFACTECSLVDIVGYCGAHGDLDSDTCACVCDATYGGDQCDQCSAAVLDPDYCSGHGTLSGYPVCQCSCDSPFAGTQCDECEAGLCSGHGSSNYEDDCACACIEPWSGPGCDTCDLVCPGDTVRSSVPGSCACDCDLNSWDDAPDGYNCTCSLECGAYGTLDADACSCTCLTDYITVEDPCDQCIDQFTFCVHGTRQVSTGCSCDCDDLWEEDVDGKCTVCPLSDELCHVADGGVFNSGTCECTCPNDALWEEVEATGVCQCKYTEADSDGACSAGVFVESSCSCECENDLITGVQCDNCPRDADFCGHGVLHWDDATKTGNCSCTCEQLFDLDSDGSCTVCVLLPEVCLHDGTLNSGSCECECSDVLNWDGEFCEECTVDEDLCDVHGTYDAENCECTCDSALFGELNCVCQESADYCNDNGDFDSENCNCTCHHPWTGTQCDECVYGDTSPCLNGGAYSEAECGCTCEVGKWEGDLCGDCARDDSFCQGNGVIVNSTCICECSEEYFSGDDCSGCSRSEDFCEHGTLGENAAEEDYCKCTCEDLWGGDSCSVCPFNATHPPSCESGSFVEENCRCECLYPFSGLLCDECVLSDADCGLPNGRGSLGDDCQCVCAGLYESEEEQGCDDCNCDGCSLLADSCVHGSSLWANGTGPCVCQCTDQWEGTYCDSCPPLDDSFCANDAVFNSTTCRCECPFAFTGDTCSDCPLTGPDCPYGVAFTTSGHCQCVCPDGFGGTYCEGCSRGDEHCSGHGYIDDVTCACKCEQLFSEETCQGCEATCLHDGELISSLDDCYCNCTYPWGGPVCGDCVLINSTDCQHGGTPFYNEEQDVCMCLCEYPWEGGLTCGECNRYDYKDDCPGWNYDNFTCECQPCVDNSTCNDHNPCTIDTCLPSGECSWEDQGCPRVGQCASIECIPDPAPGADPDYDFVCNITEHSNIPCDDQNQCTRDDICVLGHCSGQNDLDLECDDGDPCTTNWCILPEASDEATCYRDSDLLPCPPEPGTPGKWTQIRYNGQCLCQPECDTDADCVPSVPCGKAFCLENACIDDPEPPCDDGDLCTVDECVNNKCVHTDKVCESELACSKSVCDPADGLCHPVSIEDCLACFYFTNCTECLQEGCLWSGCDLNFTLSEHLPSEVAELGLGTLQNVTLIEKNSTHVWNTTELLNFVCVPKAWYREDADAEFTGECDLYVCPLPSEDNNVVIAVVTATSLLSLLPIAAAAYLIVAGVLIFRRCRRQAVPFEIDELADINMANVEANPLFTSGVIEQNNAAFADSLDVLEDFGDWQ